MRTIPLTKGKVVLVDDRNYAALSEFKWHALKSKHTWYAARTIKTSAGRSYLYMHRIIACCDPNAVVDHRDGDGLNNQFENLRSCCQKQNMANQRKFSKRMTSKFKGVSFFGGRWQVACGRRGTNRYIGRFVSEEEAARAYDVAALKLFGEFALLNFPVTPQ